MDHHGGVSPVPSSSSGSESPPLEPESDPQEPPSQSCGLLYYFEHTLVEPTSMSSSSTATTESTSQPPKAEAFVIGVEEKTPEENEMERKKKAIMMMSLKRKAETEAKKAAKELELARQKEEATLRRERSEQRKLEAKIKAQQILEQYRQRKLAEEREKANNNNSNNNKSRPPSPVQEASQSSSRSPLYSGPKLFVKPTTKTNCTIIQNALSNVLGGAANSETLRKMLDLLEKSKGICRHYLILFRDSRLQFRGLYVQNAEQGELSKLGGTGPHSITPDMIDKFYKYDSPKRQFTQIHTKHLSLTIDAFTIHTQLWLSKRPATASSKT